MRTSAIAVAVVALAASAGAGCGGDGDPTDRMRAQTAPDPSLVARKLTPYAVRSDREGSPFKKRLASVRCPMGFPPIRGHRAYICFVRYKDGSMSVWCATVIEGALYVEGNPSCYHLSPGPSRS